MRLRNKKTGKIIEYSISLNQWSEDDQEWYLFGNYDSIDELKEEWEELEDVKEPLIKDPKIRKAVRAWAEANGDTRVYYHRSTNEMCVNDDKGYVIRSIKFKFEFRESISLESGWYTLAELCGEEEE